MESSQPAPKYNVFSVTVGSKAHNPHTNFSFSRILQGIALMFFAYAKIKLIMEKKRIQNPIFIRQGL